MASITSTAIQLSKRAIARSHPGAAPEELDGLFVSLHYGPEIAEQLKRYLNHQHG